MRPIQANIFYPKTGRLDSIEKAFVEVILGRPSAKCKHLGVCKIERVYSNSFDLASTIPCQVSDRLYALASFKEDAYFELVFERGSIPNTIYEYHFKSGVFKVEEEYSTDLELGKAPILITTGEYDIRLSDTLLAIRFEIN
ncbi:MAG: hypothetical protein COA99_18610 [Moraxellaceae bacterium]|nr:MAG: hypothetical protein COA99_18610 [Moraxellaceae bacterium]